MKRSPGSSAERAAQTAEGRRLAEDARRERNWKRWGPYLAERQWATVREDYSAEGDPWSYFPHEHARSRAYRWGEDGLLGICDREGRLCFALALWNGRDPILKERLFGLTGWEGNHGEDVKELYYYLDASPTHSYLRALYKYPQRAFPYRRLLEENARRSKAEPEFELLDTGIFDDDRYFDVFVEYAKASPNDVLIRIRVVNRAREPAPLHVLPTLWFRNTWSWGRSGEGYWPKPWMRACGENTVVAEHASLGRFRLVAAPGPDGSFPQLLFTENETNARRLFGVDDGSRSVKDAFHERVVHGRLDAVAGQPAGTKVAAWYVLAVPAAGEATLRLRLFSEQEAPSDPLGEAFDGVVELRREETDAYYEALLPAAASAEEKEILRQGYAGLLWSKQFYHYVVRDWLEGDPAQPPPPPGRTRNAEWRHLYNRDVISMPDKWEYPWYAAWDLAFHMVPFATVDPVFAKEQLVLFLREWYMHPSGQLPAYEFALSDVNPPVHAWAAWRVYKTTAERGRRDRVFLERVFLKLLLNFTWWINRKDVEGKNIFSGGFLGLDNIGVFDRSRPLPTGGHLEQADGTAWMAFYCGTLLSMALELAKDDPAYEDMASKFFEHFVGIAEAMNYLGGRGLWDEEDGFYYDQLHVDGRHVPLKVRSLVGLIPLLACEVLEEEIVERLRGFHKRMRWFLDNRPDLAESLYCASRVGAEGRRLLAIPLPARLERVLRYLLDEEEFLSPFGIRSLSRVHEAHPYVFRADGREYRVEYAPGDSTTGDFGGNSNWRGPIWLPLNYLLIEALERYDLFFGDSLLVECPTGSGRRVRLKVVAEEIAERLCRLFLPDPRGRRPIHGDERRYAEDPHWKPLVLFYEYFHAETGKGLGASHQTGWTALILRLVEDRARARERR